MFDYCSLVQQKCSFAAKRGNLTYCGLHKAATLAENRVDYIKICPKEKLKKKRRQLCRITMEQKRKRKKRRKKVRKSNG